MSMTHWNQSHLDAGMCLPEQVGQPIDDDLMGVINFEDERPPDVEPPPPNGDQREHVPLTLAQRRELLQQAHDKLLVQAAADPVALIEDSKAGPQLNKLLEQFDRLLAQEATTKPDDVRRLSTHELQARLYEAVTAMPDRSRSVMVIAGRIVVALWPLIPPASQYEATKAVNDVLSRQEQVEAGLLPS